MRSEDCLADVQFRIVLCSAQRVAIKSSPLQTSQTRPGQSSRLSWLLLSRPSTKEETGSFIVSLPRDKSM
jgi:hypothetical protein